MDETPLPFDMGDTVRLKFGGPLMTVLSIAEQECCCMWFGEGAKLEHGTFEIEVIELVERAVRLVESRHSPYASRNDRRSGNRPS